MEPPEARPGRAPDATTALDKHDCAACGAQAEWHPGSQQLTCPFCGTVAPYEVPQGGGTIQELDLVTTLREIPDEERGWQEHRRSVRCQSCRAITVFESGRVGQNCEFCGSPEIVDYDEIRAPLRPSSLLPFKIAESQVRESIRRWLSSRWFAPNALKRRALVDTAHGVYVPYWTFDAQVHCPWTAQSGTYYYTTQTYRDAKGRTRTRQVRHVRWAPAAGTVDHFFDDVPVPATVGVDPALLRKLEPFPTTDLVPYDTAFLSGFVVEHYQVVLIEATQQARDRMHAALRDMCGEQVPGDTHRALSIDPQRSGETFKLILVPIWLLSYDYGRRSFQLVANGTTGRLAGRYPKSPWKIAFAVLGLLLVLLVVVLVGRT